MVDINKKRIILESADQIAKASNNSDKLFLEALVSMKPTLRRFLGLLIVSAIFSPIFIAVGFSVNVIDVMIRNVDYINSVVTTLFGILVMGYAIFQALSSGRLIISLLSYRDDNNQSYFRVYNMYFLGISALFLISVVINFCISFILKSIDPHFSMPFIGDSINNILASVLVLVYFIFHLNLLIEVKCFIINLFQCFNIYALSQVKEELGPSKEEKK